VWLFGEGREAMENQPSEIVNRNPVSTGITNKTHNQKGTTQ
jgi:hypothetical protein